MNNPSDVWLLRMLLLLIPAVVALCIVGWFST